MASRAEVLLPELHDGDADVAQVIDDRGGTRDATGLLVADGTRETPPPDQAPVPRTPAPHHGPHIDHCGHGHGVARPPAVTQPPPPPAHAGTPVETPMRLVSVVQPPQLRPPIL